LRPEEELDGEMGLAERDLTNWLLMVHPEREGEGMVRLEA
jgi:hypothetical protein